MKEAFAFRPLAEFTFRSSKSPHAVTGTPGSTEGDDAIRSEAENGMYIDDLWCHTYNMIDLEASH